MLSASWYMGLALSKHFWSDDISESRSVVYGFRDVLQDGWRMVRFHVHIRRDVTWFYVWVMFPAFEVERVTPLYIRNALLYILNALFYILSKFYCNCFTFSMNFIVISYSWQLPDAS